MTYQHRYTRLILWLTALAAFHMAWTAHDTAAFTLNAFDLAEQVSVHPAIRAESPPLRTSLLLWSAIPIIAAGIAITAAKFEERWLRWSLYGAAALVSLRVIPPESALRSPRQLVDSPHDRAQAILTLLGLMCMCLMVLLGKRILRYDWQIEAGLCAIGIALPFIGWQRALHLLDELQVDVGVGGGALIYALALLAVFLTRVKTHDPGFPRVVVRTS